ncbi:MAG: hypothetical protein DRG39_07235 [Deltaproteobacteria bacterium]|nr:MAG: hypothetical protein DRG39_07235 [Deltaproteobacteria bacterium]
MGNVEVAGIISMCDFPLAPLVAVKLGLYVDYLVLGYDVTKGVFEGTGKGGMYHYNILRSINPFKIPVDHFVIESEEEGSKAEACLRRLDNIAPKYVFHSDSDEVFPLDDTKFWKEFADFKKSDKMYMDFEFVMASVNDQSVPKSPLVRHGRIFKWRQGVSYGKYGERIRGIPRYNGVLSDKVFHASSKIFHYWAFYPEWEKRKAFHWLRRGESRRQMVDRWRAGGVLERLEGFIREYDELKGVLNEMSCYWG